MNMLTLFLWVKEKFLKLLKKLLQFSQNLRIYYCFVMVFLKWIKRFFFAIAFVIEIDFNSMDCFPFNKVSVLDWSSTGLSHMINKRNTESLRA